MQHGERFTMITKGKRHVKYLVKYNGFGAVGHTHLGHTLTVKFALT